MSAHLAHSQRDAGRRPLLFDGCPGCMAHVELGGIGLDETRFEQAWRMMLDVDLHDESYGPHSGYASALDHELCRGLYRVGIIIERFLGGNPWQWPVTISGRTA
mgnify:FL=1